MDRAPPITTVNEVLEAARLADVASYGPCLDLSESPAKTALDRALRLATGLCKVPSGVVAIARKDDVVIIASLGAPITTAPGAEILLRRCVDLARPLLAADARLIPEVVDHFLALAEGNIGFCALVPLVTPRGHTIGVLCVTDSVSRPDLGETAQAALVDLAGQIVDALELRRQILINEAMGARTSLVHHLVGLAADAADFPSAVDAAIRSLGETTGGWLCHLWRLTPSGQRAHLLRGWGTGIFGSEEYLRIVAATGNHDPIAPIMIAMTEDRQVVVEDIAAGPLARLPLLRFGAKHGLKKQIVSPLRLGEERFALVLALPEDSDDLAVLAETVRATAQALRPLLSRIKAEDKNRLLQRVFDATSDPVLITEAEPINQPGPRIVYANPAFERVTGYTEAEVLGQTPRILQGPESSAQAIATIRAALERWQPVRQALVNYRKDGSPFWSDLQISPVADAHGWYTHWVAIQRDVTDEMEAHRARIQAVRELNALIALIPGTMMRLRRSPDGVWGLSYVARTVQDLTGFAAEEAEAQGWFEAHAEPEALIRHRGEAEQASDGAQVTSVFRFRHKDGRWLWIRSIKRGQVAADGVPEVVAIWADITLERDLADQLAHAARLAQLGEVTTGLAHELNQPLASISLAAENAERYLAAEPPALDRARTKLSLIVEQAHRASAVIDHMRTFGRAEPQAVTPVCLADVLTRAVAMLHGRLSIGGIAIATEGVAVLPAVLATNIPLEQVLINLIANACDAYAEAPTVGPRRIEIRAEQVGDRARVDVSDQAGGIAPEALPRIFQPFFTTKPPGQGTGLGLSISFGIMTAMGGTLTVASEAGGACFTMTLPLAPVESQPAFGP